MKETPSTPRFGAFVSLLILALVFLGIGNFSVAANEEIGYLESFALADDREEALAQLIPGTEEYYYYQALHAQNLGNYPKVEGYFEPWLKRYGQTERFREIKHRQALLRYTEDPGKTLAYLKRELGLRFDHQQERLGAKPEFPTSLDPVKISWEAFRKEALRRSNTASQFEDSGLERWLREDAPIDEKRLRDLLARLKYPDHPRLVGLIAGDLRSKASRGFGEFPIHQKLLPEQLDELLGLRPPLANDANFVHLRMQHLRPSPDTDWTQDTEERGAYLGRLWAYARELEPTFNSLKAHVLYQLLQHRQRIGNYPRDLFLEYLRLPRGVAYVEPKWLQDPQRQRFPVDLNADFTGVTACPPVRQDEALVRDYLLNFFVEDEDWQTYAPYIRDSYLKGLFAEAKLTGGIGDAERWYSLLSPSAVQALKDRVDIEFAAGNAERFSPGDPVSLDVFLKNAGKLTVKVYEINALNFFLEEDRVLNTDLDLDGLIPNQESSHGFEGPSIRRTRHTFKFDSLTNRRGAWVIEFIGNGQSSRALVRKGRLQYLAETTPAGVAVRVLTQDNRPAKAPSVWFGGREYRPSAKSKSGIILLPFTSQSGNQSVILTDGDFATLENIELPAENYSLSAGFHLDRENLLPGKIARVAVRPRFRINAQPAGVSVLTDTKLVIRSTDHEGIDSVTEVPGFPLFDDRESVHEFRVPERLASLDVDLVAKVARISSGGEKEELLTGTLFEVNTIDTTEHVADCHLSRIADQWVLEVLGKTGEPLADRAVTIKVKHEDVRVPLTFSLKTDQQGRIRLSTLSEHQSLWVEGEGLPPRFWNLAETRGSNRLPTSVHARAGEVIQIPVARFDGKKASLSPADFTLLETRAGGFVRDVFDQIALRDGLLEITGLTPGDYELFLKNAGRRLVIRVTGAGAEVGGYALSKWRHLQIKNPKPLQIASLGVVNDKLNLKLVNANPMTRVHLVATRFIPEFPLVSLGQPNWKEPLSVTRGSAETLYLSGRDIGEEYRYILERRASKRFPGNMLDRPDLVLNPWSLRETETATIEAEAGEAYFGKKKASKSRRASDAEPAAASIQAVEVPPVMPSLDFLRDQAPLVYNLEPDEEGVITLDLADLGDRQYVQVLAVDEEDAAYRQLSLAEGEGVFMRDLRLSRNLDPSRHYSQRQKVTVLGAGDSVTLPDIRSSEMETYDTLAGIWAAMSGVHEGGDGEKLAEFAFVLDWPAYDEEKKRTLYSRNACHELNFFLSRRDPEFFEAVVKPYLANKRDKTFLDDYLMGADLKPYAQPWAFGRLNIVERILMARRLGEEKREAVARHVGELNSLTPIDPGAKVYFFQSALRGKSMWGTDAEHVVLQSLMREEETADRFADGQVLAGRGGAMGGGGVVVAGAMIMDAPASPASVAPLARDLDVAKLEDLNRQSNEPADGGAKRRLALMDGFEEMDVAEMRGRTRALFRKLEATREWAENNYHEVPIDQQVGGLIEANPFWRDFANWNGDGGFYSREFPMATGNFSEMMLALSVLDVPFSAEDHDLTLEDGALTLSAKSPVIVFHEEVEEAAVAENPTPILISQNFFREGDRYLWIDGAQSDKFVTEEFLTGVLYGGQVVATNPTSATRDIEVLLQVPRGALPANGSNYTETERVRLEPFGTQKLEYFFYFPAVSGEGESFPHYPVHVAQSGEVVAWSEPFAFKVVNELSTIDKASWDYLSQFGTNREVIAYLEQNNVLRLDLSRIAWRCREDVDFFRKTISLLKQRHAWDETLWSYGLHHDDRATSRQYLLHREDFLRQCGDWLECELVSIDPVSRHWYQHLEYQPLVNARAHQLGRDRKIPNDRFRAQYQHYLKVLGYQSEFTPSDQLGVAYYLFLQDRVEEGLTRLAMVEGDDSVASRLQRDYLRAYAAFYQEAPEQASEIAEAYADYPVDRWRQRFGQVAEQAREIRGEEVVAVVEGSEDENREQQQEALAATASNFELNTEGRTVTLDYRNLSEVRVNYYEMDLEFLFSSNPFVGEDSSRFSFIRPNVTLLKELPGGKKTVSFEIPEQFASSNVLVEIVGDGKKQSSAVYANSLKVEMLENYGRLEVRHADSGKPLSKVYVKVYGRFGDGEARFFKDGYTDLRGRFDYVSLNTGELEGVQRFSVLVLSDEDGALVREVDPPKR